MPLLYHAINGLCGICHTLRGHVYLSDPSVCYYTDPPTHQELLEDPVATGYLLDLKEKHLCQSAYNSCMKRMWLERMAALMKL